MINANQKFTPPSIYNGWWLMLLMSYDALFHNRRIK